MKLRELIAYLDAVAPRELAQEWDNVGLLCGDPDRDVNTIVVSLDADRQALGFAKEQGADVIVSHHPLIFSPVRAVTAPSVLYDLLSSGIASFAAHTNLDAAVGGVNDALAAVLGLENVEEAFGGIGRVGSLKTTMSPRAFAEHVANVLGTRVQWKSGNADIKTVALVGGSGGDFACDLQADAFVTGEMKHHEWLALPEKLTAVVAGHYATEAVIVEPLSRRIREAYPDCRVLSFVGNAPYQTL